MPDPTHGVRISRVIEYLPTGEEAISKDCTFDGKSYSAGAVIPMADGKLHECTGDAKGSWAVKT